MDENRIDNYISEEDQKLSSEDSQRASGSPYWNGIEQNPEGGYRFTGQGGQVAYSAQGPRSSSGTTAKRMPGWVKGLIIFLVICIGVIGIGVACSRAVQNITGTGTQNTPSYDFSGDYIGVLYLEGTITDGVSSDGYSQEWMLERIYQMTDEHNNKGILLHVNTPGGSAYATAEVYNALKEYKGKTGNPVYVYMGSQATSGGYYVAMAADKIYANPECWTGSIGVVVGTLYDFSELMEKYGIKATNIVSGANKDMGSNAKPLTEEQIEILQSLVDDSFDRFVAAVVDGRGLAEERVRELADGRIYTAAQAEANGLIDKIGSLDDAVADMKAQNGLSGVKTENIVYQPENDLLDLFGLGFNSQRRGGVSGYGDLSILMSLMESSSEVSIEFICPIRK